MIEHIDPALETAERCLRNGNLAAADESLSWAKTTILYMEPAQHDRYIRMAQELRARYAAIVSSSHAQLSRVSPFH